jgi:Fic family protein
MECMGALELFLHDQPESTPPLLKAALAHVQFETIHPFLDGNGRVGRLLITLLLCEQGVLREPMLYLSLFFKTHRQTYYDLLDKVRRDGDWEAWLTFFAEAVTVTVRRLESMAEEDRKCIQSLGRASGTALQIHHEFLIRPIWTSPDLVDRTGITPLTVNRSLEKLCSLGVLQELTGQKRNRIFAYTQYLDIFNEGTELPSA